MIEHQDYLSLIAELAVALAGFTGIVAVFRYRSSERWRHPQHCAIPDHAARQPVGHVPQPVALPPVPDTSG